LAMLFIFVAIGFSMKLKLPAETILNPDREIFQLSREKFQASASKHNSRLTKGLSNTGKTSAYSFEFITPDSEGYEVGYLTESLRPGQKEVLAKVGNRPKSAKPGEDFIPENQIQEKVLTKNIRFGMEFIPSNMDRELLWSLRTPHDELRVYILGTFPLNHYAQPNLAKKISAFIKKFNVKKVLLTQCGDHFDFKNHLLRRKKSGELPEDLQLLELDDSESQLSKIRKGLFAKKRKLEKLYFETGNLEKIMYELEISTPLKSSTYAKQIQRWCKAASTKISPLSETTLVFAPIDLIPLDEGLVKCLSLNGFTEAYKVDLDLTTSLWQFAGKRFYSRFPLRTVASYMFWGSESSIFRIPEIALYLKMFQIFCDQLYLHMDVNIVPGASQVDLVFLTKWAFIGREVEKVLEYSLFGAELPKLFSIGAFLEYAHGLLAVILLNMMYYGSDVYGTTQA